MERNLVTSLILYESIRTTRKRAKVVQPIIDRLITTAKRQSPMLAIRAINRVITDKNASRKLIENLRLRFADRPSGFTSLKAAGARKGDGADLVDLAFMAGKEVAPPPAKTEKKTARKAAKKEPPATA